MQRKVKGEAATRGMKEAVTHSGFGKEAATHKEWQ